VPLQGERRDTPTYIDIREITDGSNQLVRCSHRVLGARCVQKTVPIGPAGAAFAEPRLLEALDHPHIPPIREAQFDPERDNCITFVMPWFPGGSVARALVDGHQFSLHETIGIVRDVLDALEYVHTVHRYLHRDVKTSNILLDELQRAGFLTDFERAAPVSEDGTTQAVMATVFYMAPECAVTGRHSVQSDIYGVGVVLFEMLNGRFAWESFDPAETERRVLAGRRSFPDRLVAPAIFSPEIPAALVRITRKAISLNPAARYGSAREFLAALNGVATIDWRKRQVTGLEGEWFGTWPPRTRPEARYRYRVSSQKLASGRQRGRLRLVAETQRPDMIGWRRFGVPDRTVGSQDREAVRQFFSDVLAKAAHRRPAR
jgi:serine/threonine protein kinase